MAIIDVVTPAERERRRLMALVEQRDRLRGGAVSPPSPASPPSPPQQPFDPGQEGVSMAPSAPPMSGGAPLPPVLGGGAPPPEGQFVPQFDSWSYQREKAARGEQLPLPTATQVPVEDPIERERAPVPEALKDLSVLTPKMQLEKLREARGEDMYSPLTPAIEEFMKEQGVDPTPITQKQPVPIIANVIENFVSQTSKTAPGILAAAERRARKTLGPRVEPNTATPVQFVNPTKQLQELQALPLPVRWLYEAGMIMLADVGPGLDPQKDFSKGGQRLGFALILFELLTAFAVEGGVKASMKGALPLMKMVGRVPVTLVDDMAAGHATVWTRVLAQNPEMFKMVDSVVAGADDVITGAASYRSPITSPLGTLRGEKAVPDELPSVVHAAKDADDVRSAKIQDSENLTADEKITRVVEEVDEAWVEPIRVAPKRTVKEVLEKGGYREPVETLETIEKQERRVSNRLRGLAGEFDENEGRRIDDYGPQGIEDQLDEMGMLDEPFPRSASGEIDIPATGRLLRNQAEEIDRGIGARLDAVEKVQLQRREEAMERGLKSFEEEDAAAARVAKEGVEAAPVERGPGYRTDPVDAPGGVLGGLGPQRGRGLLGRKVAPEAQRILREQGMHGGGGAYDMPENVAKAAAEAEAKLADVGEAESVAADLRKQLEEGGAIFTDAGEVRTMPDVGSVEDYRELLNSYRQSLDDVANAKDLHKQASDRAGIELNLAIRGGDSIEPGPPKTPGFDGADEAYTGPDLARKEDVDFQDTSRRIEADLDPEGIKAKELAHSKGTAKPLTFIDRAKDIKRRTEKYLTDRSAWTNNATGRAKAAYFASTGKELPPEWQAELWFGLYPGAARPAADRALRIIESIRGILGNDVRWDSLNLYLKRMFQIDILNMRGRAGPSRVGIASTAEELANPTLEEFAQRGGFAEQGIPGRPSGMTVHEENVLSKGGVIEPGAQTPGQAAEDAPRIPLSPQDVAAGRQRGMNMAELEAEIKQMQADYTPEQWQRLTRASNLVTAHYGDMLDMKVIEGLVSGDLADTLKGMYPHYNPIVYLKGWAEPAMDGIPRERIAGVSGEQIARLADEDVILADDLIQSNPLDILAGSTVSTYMAIARNKAARAQIASLLADPEMSKTVTIAGVEQEVAYAAAINQMPGLFGGKPALTGAVTQQVADVTQEITSIRRIGARQNLGADRGKVGFFEGGESRIFDVPKEAAEDMKNLTDVSFEGLDHVLRMVNAPFRAAFTSHNPAFMAVNFVHDTWVLAATQGVMPWETAMGLARAFKSIVKESPVLRSMIDEGADVGGWTGRRTQEIVKQPFSTRQGRRRPVNMMQINNMDDWKTVLGSPTHLLNQMARAFETGPRIAMYQKGIQRGLSAPEAALGARRATLDHQRYGLAVRRMDAAFLYLNASVQGSLIPARALLTSGKKLRGRGLNPGQMLLKGLAGEGDTYRARMGLMGLMTVAAMTYGWNRRYESYRDMSLADKYGNLTIMYGEGRNEYGNLEPYGFNIGLLREFSAFTAPVLYALQALDEKDPEAVTKLLEYLTPGLEYSDGVPEEQGESATVGQMATTLIPPNMPGGPMLDVGGRDASFSFGGLAVPTHGGLVLGDILRNHNSFRNEPLIDDQMATLNREDQFDHTTSEVAKRVAKGLPLAPKQIDHLMKLGVFKEMVHSIDLFLNREIDPEVQALAADLDMQMENVSDDEKSRTYSAFFAEGRAFELKDKIEMERRIPDDAQVPFGETIVKRFNRRNSGGQQARTGALLAAKELGIDPMQTKKAAHTLSGISDMNKQQQGINDAAVAAGTMSHREWKEAHKDIGVMYQGSLMAIANVYPESAQIKKNEEGTLGWTEYKRIAATAGEMFPDRRTHGQVLAAGYRGIPLTHVNEDEFGTAIPDFSALFEKRKDYTNALNEAEKELLNLELTANRTKKEQEYLKDMAELRSYWDIAREMLHLDAPEQMPDAFRDLWSRWLNANDAQKAKLKLEQGFMLSILQGKLREKQLAHRQGNQEMDWLYLKWGYAQRPAHYANVSRYLEFLGQTQPAQPSEMGR
jgi:hypothetical protein